MRTVKLKEPRETGHSGIKEADLTSEEHLAWLAEEHLCAKCTRVMRHTDATQFNFEPGDICDDCAQTEVESLRAELSEVKAAIEAACENAIRNAEQSENLEVRGFALAVIVELRALLKS